jgi:hypothetical protein
VVELTEAPRAKRRWARVVAWMVPVIAVPLLAVITTVPAQSAECVPVPPANTDLLNGPARLKIDLASYNVRSTYQRWAVVAVRRSYTGDDPDLRFGMGGCLVESSQITKDSATDWVAVDTARLQGSFVAQVTEGMVGVPDGYAIQFDDGGTLSLSRGRLYTSIGYADRPWIADARDMQLRADLTYTFDVRGGGYTCVFIFSSSGNDLATMVRSPHGTAPGICLGGVPDAMASGSFTYEPATDGRYGVLFTRMVWEGLPVSVRVTGS